MEKVSGRWSEMFKTCLLSNSYWLVTVTYLLDPNNIGGLTSLIRVVISCWCLMRYVTLKEEALLIKNTNTFERTLWLGEGENCIGAFRAAFMARFE